MKQLSSATSSTLICYAIQATGIVSLFLFPVWLVYFLYLKSKYQNEELEATHLKWQQRTSLYLVVFFLLGLAILFHELATRTAGLPYGSIVIIAALVFSCMRTVYGAIQLIRSKPM